MRIYLFLTLILLPLPLPLKAAQECVNIFYDKSPDSEYWMGRTYSIMLQNLLGHFPQLQQIVSPIELYEKGDTEKCRATFYLASYFDNKIPQAFLDDYKNTHKTVVWLGYSIWQLGDSFEKLFGYRYQNLTSLDKKNLDIYGYPTFFKWIDYKGETFYKFGDWSKDDQKNFLAPFEQVRLIESVAGKSTILASARHNFTNEKIPYAIRCQNRFYLADIPFSYIHEADRYLIFSDLLFDILQIPAKDQKRAFLRVEDVHALTPLHDLTSIINVLREEGVPANISLIPIFFDPLKVYSRPTSDEYLTIDRKPEFLSYITELKNQGASFIWHGVTHQYQRRKNPHNGSSGDDFEFWDAINNSPIKEDTPRWVINRLYDGLFTLLKSGLPAPKVWLTPHYQASALDYLIFARLFPWNAGRVIYFDFNAENFQNTSNGEFWLNNTNTSGLVEKIEYFSQAKITMHNKRWNGQFFPYEIYGDLYGQRLIPENLGNSQPYISEHVIRTRSAEEIVKDAKRNLIIRDAWASFFYHPYLLQPFESGGRGAFPGDPKELKYIVSEIKKLGYTFVSADEFAANNTNPIRPEPIYRGYGI